VPQTAQVLAALPACSVPRGGPRPCLGCGNSWRSGQRICAGVEGGELRERRHAGTGAGDGGIQREGAGWGLRLAERGGRNEETSHHRHGTKPGGLIASLVGAWRSVRTVAQQRPESDAGQQHKGDKTRCIISGVFGIELGNFNGRSSLLSSRKQSGKSDKQQQPATVRAPVHVDLDSDRECSPGRCKR